MEAVVASASIALLVTDAKGAARSSAGCRTA